MKPVQVSSSTSQPSNSAAMRSQLKAANSRISELERKLASLSKFVNVERAPGLKEQYAEYRDHVLADYIYGLYHPDIVFTDSLDIKSPSYIQIPTTTFRFKETFTIAPNRYGNFALFWEPNFLGTSRQLSANHGPGGFDPSTNVYFSNIYVNNDDALDGNAWLSTGWKGMCFKDVQQDFQKYRLTSACMKVSYTGRVLDQAGMFASAASYVSANKFVRGVPVTEPIMSSFDIPSNKATNLAQFCDFDNIRQGQWAKTTSVTADPTGLTCIYVPTDPLNQVFVDNAQTIDSLDKEINYPGTGYLTSWHPRNTNLSYAFCGYGLAPAVSCVTVECYYNFEIIVKQEQYPYFNPRSADSALLARKVDVSRITDAVSSTGLVTRTKSHTDSSVLNKLRKAFSDAYQFGREVFPFVKPLLSALV